VFTDWTDKKCINFLAHFSALFVFGAVLYRLSAFQRCYHIACVSVVQPGMLLVGILKRRMNYGVFVTMLNNLTGLAPNKVFCSLWCCHASAVPFLLCTGVF